ncbi:hypothetical protein J6590_011892 [Homalodisca vitripennis]|nr:hypothetical protein J6590_011892 [Homalodisca vitripennis]
MTIQFSKSSLKGFVEIIASGVWRCLGAVGDQADNPVINNLLTPRSTSGHRGQHKPSWSLTRNT